MVNGSGNGDLQESADDAGPTELQKLWNETAHANLPRCRGLSDKRKRHCKARLKDRDINGWREVIAKVNASAFLRGEKGTWRASFDWLIESPDSALKVLEGKYDDLKPVVDPTRGRIGAETQDHSQIGEVDF